MLIAHTFATGPNSKGEVLTVPVPRTNPVAWPQDEPKVVVLSGVAPLSRNLLDRLEGQFSVLWVATPDAAIEALDRHLVAVVLTDQPPGGTDDLLTRVRIHDPQVIGLCVPPLPEVSGSTGAVSELRASRSARLRQWDDAVVAAVQQGFATNQAIRDRHDARDIAADLADPVDELRDDGWLAQFVADGIVRVDAAGIVRYANPRAVAMLGRPPAELIGTRQSDLFYELVSSGRVFSPPRSSIEVSIQAGTPVRHVQARFARSDGSPFPVELSVGPIVESGRVLGAVVAFRDVSARVAVDTMRNQFVSVVSHELRTPLTAIRGSLGLLAAGKCGTLSPAGERMITIALDSSLRLGRLIEDMLDIEAIDAGSTRFVPSDCDTETLIRTAMSDCAPIARQHGVSLASDGRTETVHGDPDRIVQVLINLLVNAVKFSPAGETVTISTCRRDDLVEFAIADHGRGIPADKTARIFERFEQVDSSDAREHGGVGLGLAICRDIVRLHHGQIWVVSTPGEGSTFRFTLPRACSAGSSTLVRRTELDHDHPQHDKH